MPDYNLGHDEKTIIFMLLCEPIAHVDSRSTSPILGGNLSSKKLPDKPQ
jgi:hypothetical protein